MFSVEFIRWDRKDVPTVVLRLEETFDTSIAALKRADAFMPLAQKLAKADLFRVSRNGTTVIEMSRPVIYAEDLE